MRLVVIGVIGLNGLGMALGMTGCDSDGGTCQGPMILPAESPKALGPFRVLADGEVHQPGSPAIVPYEWTLFLQNDCGEPLKIDKVCVIGDGHNGDEDDPSFLLEGPVPATVTQGNAAALRVTFDNDEPNRDRDDDGARDPDNVAIVVQSNATNFPTLVVPVCALIVPRDELASASFSCTSPLTVPAGKADRTLCADE